MSAISNSLGEGRVSYMNKNIEKTLDLTSLEVSKELSDLKVTQNSLYYWRRVPYGKATYITSDVEENLKEEPSHYITLASAFSISELLRLLPREITAELEISKVRKVKATYRLSLELDSYQNPSKNVYRPQYTYAYYTCGETDTYYLPATWSDSEDESLATALGKLLVWLIENNYLDIKEINKLLEE